MGECTWSSFYNVGYQHRHTWNGMEHLVTWPELLSISNDMDSYSIRLTYVPAINGRQLAAPPRSPLPNHVTFISLLSLTKIWLSTIQTWFIAPPLFPQAANNTLFLLHRHESPITLFPQRSLPQILHGIPVGVKLSGLKESMHNLLHSHAKIAFMSKFLLRLGCVIRINGLYPFIVHLSSI